MAALRDPKKAYLGAWLYAPKNHPACIQLCKQLVAPNPIYAASMKQSGLPPETGEPEFDNLWREDETHYWFPRAAAEPFFPNVIDRRVDAPVKMPAPTLTYRAGQQEFVQGILARIQTRAGIIGKAATGFGKTATSVDVMQRFGQRVIVLVHTGFLMKQWQEAFEKGGFRADQIGLIWQNKCEWGGQYLVSIAMAQTLLARRQTYPRAFFDAFGFMVVDEVHNFGATSFRKTITLFRPKARLGVSATPNRKDGCEIVFASHIGNVGVVGKKQTLVPAIRYVYIEHQFEDGDYRAALQRNKYNPFKHRREWQDAMDKVETYLVNHHLRNKRLVSIAVASARKGRKTLFLTTRLDHLALLEKWITKALHDANVRAHVGILKGGMKPIPWAVACSCPIIIGTYAVAKEGLDIPTLDAMVFATPRADIIQSVGRILRDLEGKKMPVVIDVLDLGIEMAHGLARKRIATYIERKWVDKKHWPEYLPAPPPRKGAVIL